MTLRDLFRPICPRCLGEGGHMSGYYEPEFYGCRCCNPEEENDDNPTRIWRWRSWIFRIGEWHRARRIDRWIDEEVKKMEAQVSESS